MVEHCSSHHRACISRGHMMKRRPWDDTTCTPRGLWTTNHKDMTRTRTLVRNLTPKQINTKKKTTTTTSAGFWMIDYFPLLGQPPKGSIWHKMNWPPSDPHQALTLDMPLHLRNMLKYIWCDIHWNNSNSLAYLAFYLTSSLIFFFAAANLTFCLTYIPLYSDILI